MGIGRVRASRYTSGVTKPVVAMLLLAYPHPDATYVLRMTAVSKDVTVIPPPVFLITTFSNFARVVKGEDVTQKAFADICAHCSAL